MIIYLINRKPSTFSKLITDIEAKTKEESECPITVSVLVWLSKQNGSRME